MEVKAAISEQEGEFMRKMREEVMDKFKTELVGLEDQLKSLKTQSQNYQVQQKEQSAQLSSNVTEANFSVKQYQVHIDQFKDEVSRKIEAQPQAM